QQTARAVEARRVDLGSVGAHVFNTLGVNSFQPLGAPMLIDSYPLERAVITSSIPGQMLTDLDKLKVIGLGILADGLRKPIAVARPLLGPADWRGISFAGFRSRGQAQAVEALGARPSDVIGEELTVALANGSVQGAENNLLVYENATRQSVAPYVTANVNLWPKTVALFANPGRFAKLSAEQQRWLRQAAREVALGSTGLFQDEGGLVAKVCAARGRLANASPADLVALGQALSPVYASLEQDLQTKGFIEAIRRLKRSTSPGPALAIPPGCEGRAIEGHATDDPIAGT